MQNEKKQQGKLLLVIAVVALAMVVVVACKERYTLYTKNFKIEKVYMTPVIIDSFPAEPAKFYLLEVAFSDCPPEKEIYDGAVRGYKEPYRGGSIDTIVSVNFSSNGVKILPTKLHWYDCPDSLSAYMNLYDTNNKIKYHQVHYLAEENYLTLMLMEATTSIQLDVCRHDTSYKVFNHIIGFNSNIANIDDGYIIFNDRKIRIKIMNPTQKMKIIGNIEHYENNAYFKVKIRKQQKK